MIQGIKTIDSTIRIYAYFYDTDGSAKNPDTSFNIEIKSADGTSVVSSTAMTNESTGVYYYDWNITAVSQGYYIAQFEAVDSGVTYKGSEDIYILTEALTSGEGSKPATIHLTEDNSGEPLSGVLVWLTDDPAGLNEITERKPTNSFGFVTFYVDSGTYYVWTDKKSSYIQTIIIS